MPPGSGLDTVFFVNSGSEANDLAWRLATAATGRRGGICTDHAYHGISEAIAALSPESWHGGPRPSHVADALALAFTAFTIRLVVSAIGGLVLLFGGADFKAAPPPQYHRGAEATEAETSRNTAL